MRPSGTNLIAGALVLLLAAASVRAVDVFDERGLNKNRNYFTQLPYEHVDPLTGNLLLTFTDLVLPGNAGFDLRIQRTYNSKIYADYSHLATSLYEDSWAGVGWTFHLGRVFNVLASEIAKPVIEMPDGSQHRAYTHVAPPAGCTPCFITRDYWIFDKDGDSTTGGKPVLRMPDGLVYTFGHQVTLNLQSVAYVTQIADPFGNTITVTYGSGAPGQITQIQQNLGTQVRTITFGALGSWGNLTSMTYVGDQAHTWTYTHDHPSGLDVDKSLLKEVRPPVGPSWTYGYNQLTGTPGPWELRQMTAPAGGQVSYQFADFQTRLGTTELLWFRGVQSRTTSGPGVLGGTWTYGYAQGTAKNQTTITGPCGDATVYVYLGVGNSVGVPAWQVGLISSRTLSGAGTSQREDYVWRSPAFGDRISDDDDIVGFNTASEVYVPLTQSVTTSTTAGGTTRTFTTSHQYSSTNLNDYGTANRHIEESTTMGATRRITDLYYQHAFGTNYIRARPTCEVRTVGTTTFSRPAACSAPGPGESILRQWAYESTGFLTSQTETGLTTTFIRSARGDVASRTNGNVHTTSYTYSYGSLQNTTTPHFTVTRTIDPEGTVESETQRGFTTAYQYDTLLRMTQETPPVGDPRVTVYDNTTGRAVSITRGSSSLTTTLDGFGLETDTQDAVGVKTKATYDACGRKTFESYAYEGSSPIGTQIAYDVLGRVITRTSPDSSVTTYAYTGIDVAITDERGFRTVQAWQAFGTPEDRRLASVSEPDKDVQGITDGLTQYAYNVTGNLTSVIQPDGSQRTWAYYGASEAWPGLLKSETHPEKGTVSYTQYDGAGNLKTRVDSFGTTTYGYDANERLVSIDRPGSGYDTVIGYDESDNRACVTVYASSAASACSVATGTVKSTFTWDGANRLQQRVDAVGGRVFTANYTYWGHDGLRLLTYPSGRQVYYEYDNGPRIRRLANAEVGPSIVYADGFAYHPSGGATAFKPGGAGAAHPGQTFTYHPLRYWLTSVNTGARSLAYASYDLSGNVESITDSRPGLNRSFTYDGLNRLKTATGYWGAAATFLYDKLGNRTNDPISGSSNWTYTSGRLANAPGLGAFTYDPSGNVTSDGARSYTYTPANMVETTSAAGATTTYKYDGDDLRKLKIDAAATRYTVHGPSGQILSEYEEVPGCGQVTWVRDYVYAGTRLVASIRPDTIPATVSVVAAGSSVSEGGGTAAIQVRLTTPGGAPLLCPVSVNYATANGTASASADYASATGVLTFPASSPNNSLLSIPVPILNDAVDEDDEYFTVNLTGAAGGALGPAVVHTVTITDDDPVPALSISDVGVVEGHAGTREAVFTVTLAPASGRSVSVGWSTAAGTATAGTDFVSASGNLSFASGQTTQTVRVTVIGDRLGEAAETFFVDLSSPVNATLSDGRGVGTILPDDPQGGDASGDGFGDVLLRHTTNGDVRILPSTGTGFTWQGYSWSSGFVSWHYDVYFADVDGDSKADLVSRNKSSGSIEVYRSTGTSFAYLAGSGPNGVWSYGWGTSYDLYFGDVTGDGRADLVGRLTSNGDVYVFPSTGNGFTSASPGGLWSYGWSSGYSLYLADVTGDGRQDLVGRYFGPTPGETGNVYVAISSGSGFTFNGRWTYGYSAGYDLYLGDATGDGLADLVARYTGNGDVYVMASTGSAFSWPGGSSNPWTAGWGSTYELIVRDFTGDGRHDLAGRDTGNGNVVVARSTGSAYSFQGTWMTGIVVTYEMR